MPGIEPGPANGHHDGRTSRTPPAGGTVPAGGVAGVTRSGASGEPLRRAGALEHGRLDQLQAVRSGPWKLHFPHRYRHITRPGRDGKPGATTQPAIELSLFDLESDPAETQDVADKHPEVVARLQKLAEVCMDDLGDARTSRAGKGVRPPGKVGE